MHSDKYCGETIDTILKGENALLWEYLPQRAIQLFQDALTAEVGSEPPEEPVPAERIWRKLEDEIICHSCFQDYITVVGTHPPNDVRASMADCSAVLGGGFAPRAPAGGDVEQEVSESVNGGDADQEAQQAEVPNQQLPPYHASVTWKDLYNYELHEFKAKAWLPDLNADTYGGSWPMILTVMTIGIKELGDGECKCLAIHCLSPKIISRLYSSSSEHP
jgi:hypothetical protein